MRRPKRDIEIFSLSALDLFASALGSFIVLMTIMSPYYKNTGDQEAAVAELRKRAQELAPAAEQSRREDAAARLPAEREKIEKTKAEVATLDRENEDLRGAMERTDRFGLLGIETRAKNFVIVYDNSLGMRPYHEAAMQAVERVIAPLRESNLFALIVMQAFSERTKGVQRFEEYVATWRGTEQPPFLSSMREWVGKNSPNFLWSPIFPGGSIHGPFVFASATADSRAGAKRWLGRIAPFAGGSMSTRVGVLTALEYEGAAIILVGRGETELDPDEALTEITRKNNGKHEIHAIAVGDFTTRPRELAFLQQLTAKNRGTFLGIGGP